MAQKDKTKLEEQLLQVQKMDSVGKLAGGIVHDFNNILTGIMGYAEMLRIKYSDINTSDGKAVNVIFKCAEEAAELTKQLLNYSREGDRDKIPLCISGVIEEVLKVLEKVFKKNIKVIYDNDNIKPIEGDRNQIYHMLMNIILNAKDAMPYGGDLNIKTEDVYFDEKYVEKHSELDIGDYVKISISDTGVGMSKEVVDKIFEPFYTTKEKGKGTGLGLASVYGIVRNHRGNMNAAARSIRGQHSTFIFLHQRERCVRK